MRNGLSALVACFLVSHCPAAAQIREPARTSVQSIVKARPLPVSSVRLRGGPLKIAQDLDAEHLLELQPDRMVSFLRQRAGLKPKAEGYGGWDAGTGKQLTGHIAGHYLSAVSLMWAATGDSRFKDRADYLVQELKAVQDANGDGYIGALRDARNFEGKIRFLELARGVIHSSGFELNGLWSPWYVHHKLYAGLRDAYRLTGNRTALDVEVRFAEWADRILADLDGDQVQQMLNTEFGGMNEVAADLYADTGDKRWLALSDKFYHHAVIDPLASGEDILSGRHGNTLVPKLIGHISRYLYTGVEVDGSAARVFWNQVALHHSFATGGHGKNEYFGPPDKLYDMIDGRTAETCNVYNMLKLTRMLFSTDPSVRYADFHERALFNHILGSIDPEDGRTCYMVPVGRSVQHEYQDMQRSFTCCVGSGMESHALHGYGIYYESDDKLWVNLYVPSTAEWKSAGTSLEVITSLPEGETASLRITARAPRKFTLALRRPSWTGEGFHVRVNGRVIGTAAARGYVEITRTWRTGDTVECDLPKSLRAEPLPDNPQRRAFLWGPLVLAGDLGPELQDRRRRSAEAESVPQPPPPVIVTAEKDVGQWLRPVSGFPGSYRTAGVGRDRDIDFVPFYRLHRRRYGIYWDVFSPAEWQQKKEDDAAKEERRKRIDAATIATVQPGQSESEREFNLRGENSSPVQLQGHHGRRGSGWFSFDLPVDASHPTMLIVTYTNDEQQRRTFDILVEGRKIGEQTLERRTPDRDVRLFDVEYVIPAGMSAGRQRITVRFQATGGNSTGAVVGLRTVRVDQ